MKSLSRRPWRPARVRHVHISGRFDRSPALLRAQLRRDLPRADVVTLTEVQGADRGAVLEEFEDDWVVIRAPGQSAIAESAIMVRRTRFRYVAHGFRMLGTAPGLRKAIAVPWAVVEDLHTGHRVLIIAGHLPTKAEPNWARKGHPNVQAMRGCLARLRYITDTLVHRHRTDAVITSCDWNLNLRVPWVGPAIKAALAGQPVPRRLLPARGGTHGTRRWIDWPIVRRMATTRARLLPWHRASDHRAARFVHRYLRAPRHGLVT